MANRAGTRRSGVGAFIGGLLVFGLVLGACATTSEPCRRQLADCLKRCDASGADPSPPPGSPAEESRSLCERNCVCRPPKQTSPAPASRPTPTGSVQ